MNNIFIPFSKSDDEKRLVYGYASTEALDSQGEIVAKSAIEDALPDYMKFANIREMHTTSAVGKTHEATIDEKGLFLCVKVVDDNAWQKVKEGVYNGFSIGGKKITKVNNTITKMKLTEISLVDRPANPEATFTMYKGEDMDKDQEPKDEDKKDKSKGKDGEASEKEDGTEDDGKEKSDKKDAKKGELDGDMAKGMYQVGRFADIIESLAGLCSSIEYEAQYEGDGSTIPAELKEQIKNLIVVLKKLVEEETAELVGETAKADTDTDMAKAGASISTANKAKLQSIIDTCKEMMGEMDAEKGEANDDLAKGADMAKTEDVDLLKSELAKKDDTIAKMQDRITELEKMPQAPKGSLKNLSKADDYSGNGKKGDEEKIVKNADGSVNEVASAIAQAQQNPIVVKKL